MFKPRPSFAALAIVLALTAALTLTRARAHTPAAHEPVRVGVFLDLSGQTSGFGVAVLDGVRMAADEINASGGIDGRPLVLLFKDDGGQPARAADAARSLILEQKAHALGLLADAVRRAGSTDPAELRDAVARTRNYAGVTGTIDIDAARDAVKPAAVFRLQDRKFVYHETVAPDAPEKD